MESEVFASHIMKTCLILNLHQYLILQRPSCLNIYVSLTILYSHCYTF